jgi:hypothetical protein
MSSASASSVSPVHDAQADLLERLYHEIGLSAVAAALEILDAPEAAEIKPVFDLDKLPAILREDAAAA